jgi:hypothetical protein
MQAALGKLDLVPLQVAQLARTQAVAISDEDHRGIAVAMAAAPTSAVHQPLNLALGEIAP